MNKSDDTISRHGAVEGVKELFACADVGNDECDITYMLENLPSADRPTGWIPISERLPKECDGHVLVSKEDGQVTTGLHSEFSNVWYIGDMCGVGECKVIAWMPLPEPYNKEVK